MKLNFKEWLAEQELNEDHGTASKTGLYPKGYGGIGLYPLQNYINQSADAITYVLQDKRLTSPDDWKGTGQRINLNANTGEGGLFDIRHLKGPVISPPPDGESRLIKLGLEGPSDGKSYGFTGERGLWDLTKQLGADPQSEPTHDANTGEGGKFDITKIKGTVITPKTLEGKPWKLYDSPGK